MQPGDQRPQEIIAQYRTLLETSIDGFFVNVGGRFHYVNPALSRMLGAKSEAELLGRLVFDFIDPASHDAVRQRISAIQASTEPVMPLEEKYVRLDGSLLDVEVTAVAIVQDTVHAILVTVRDISERKNAERAQRRLEDQLRQSQKMEALGTMAGGIAHDFNNILAAVVGNAELTRALLVPGHAAERYLDEILAAVSRAKGLTMQVLAFARRRPPALRVLDLRATVTEALSLLGAAVPVGTSLEMRLDPGCYPVLADVTQIHQVLLNLCTNAWQSFEGPSGHITVGLRACTLPGDDFAPPDLPAGRYAALSVEDDGPGIDENILDRIFDPFFTTKEPGKGTGLGLSVVHGIVKSHGARITCNSQVGRGTAFLLYLPLAAGEIAPAPAESLADAPAGDGQRILFLDDEAVLVNVAKQALEARGYRVSGFTLPAAALAALRAEPDAFDLLITDLKMPGQTGLEVSRAAYEINPRLPVILISGLVEEGARNPGAAPSIREVLRKPVRSEALCHAIARALATPEREPRQV